MNQFLLLASVLLAVAAAFPSLQDEKQESNPLVAPLIVLLEKHLREGGADIFNKEQLEDIRDEFIKYLFERHYFEKVITGKLVPQSEDQEGDFQESIVKFFKHLADKKEAAQEPFQELKGDLKEKFQQWKETSATKQQANQEGDQQFSQQLKELLKEKFQQWKETFTKKQQTDKDDDKEPSQQLKEQLKEKFQQWKEAFAAKQEAAQDNAGDKQDGEVDEIKLNALFQLFLEFESRFLEQKQALELHLSKQDTKRLFIEIFLGFMQDLQEIGGQAKIAHVMKEKVEASQKQRQIEDEVENWEAKFQEFAQFVAAAQKHEQAKKW